MKLSISLYFIQNVLLYLTQQDTHRTFHTDELEQDNGFQKKILKTRYMTLKLSSIMMILLVKVGMCGDREVFLKRMAKANLGFPLSFLHKSEKGDFNGTI